MARKEDRQQKKRKRGGESLQRAQKSRAPMTSVRSSNVQPRGALRKSSAVQEKRVHAATKPTRTAQLEMEKETGFRASDWTMPVVASVETEEQLGAVLQQAAVQCIYVDEAGFPNLAEAIQQIHAAGRQAGLRLRRIQRDLDASGRRAENSVDILRKLLCEDTIPDAVLVRNLDEAMLLEDFFTEEPAWRARICRVFDYTVYGYNEEAMRALESLGAMKLTYPIELTGPECRRLPKLLPMELLIYGHLPMMVSANCIQRTSAHCDHGNRILQLRDRMGKDMPVRCYCSYCYNQIFNADPLVLYDLPEEVKALQPQCVRYDFSVETPAVVRQVLEGCVPVHRTRGHFRHGIE
mgnify:FL=1